MIARACKMCVSPAYDVCVYLLVTCDYLPGSETTNNLLRLEWNRSRDGASKSGASMEDTDSGGPGLKDFITKVEGWWLDVKLCSHQNDSMS